MIGGQHCADDFEVIWREFPRRPEHGPAEGDEGGTVLCASHMTRNGAAFESTMLVTSGTHRMMLRIDGGEWRAPANAPTVDDDFGGRVGLLVVP